MYLQVKKIPTVKSKKKINQLPVLMPRLNGVRGDKVFFPPTKDIGIHEKEFSQVQVSIFLYCISEGDMRFLQRPNSHILCCSRSKIYSHKIIDDRIEKSLKGRRIGHKEGLP